MRPQNTLGHQSLYSILDKELGVRALGFQRENRKLTGT